MITQNSKDIMLPSEAERIKIFYWLKKISSVTAWRRIFEFYKNWAAVAENSVREADNKGWSEKTALPLSEYALILKGLAHCEEGVTRLSKGDKRVFKFDAYGEFEMSRRILSHWIQMKSRVDEGENGIDEAHTPFWFEFTESLLNLSQAWDECSSEILEPRYLEDPALTLYGVWLDNELKTMYFPSELEPVPDPNVNKLIFTGKNIPFSGIWEPVESNQKNATLLSLLKAVPELQKPYEIMGSMNYLHGGSKAPQITIENQTENIDLNTTWRLLWRDDRYTDGSIPEVESSYRFNMPVKSQLKKITFIASDVIWATSGSEVDVTGVWLLESDMKVSVKLKKGEFFPFNQGIEVRWVLST